MTVTVTVRVSDSAGNETVQTHSFQVGGSVPLAGDVSGTFGDAHIVGDINLTGNLTITGVLTGVDTFRCQGNGFSVFFEQGGRADLHGKVKAAWGPWGTDSTGWVVGDRIIVSPTKVGVLLPTEMTWTGSWATMTRPITSPNVTLVDRVATPEVANLSQSIVFENLARGWHIHGSGGVFNVSDIKMLNCGTSGVLGNYPIHFHQTYDNSRGSRFERVVVQEGKNHAFVPHGSHGITFKDCVAYRTLMSAYWWDFPPVHGNPINDSHDTNWEHCLASVVFTPSGVTDHLLTGFVIGAGNGNRCVDSVATCVFGGLQSSGFLWSDNFVWEFSGCTAHNVRSNAIHTWTNSGARHIIEDFVGYHYGRAGIEHGAYINQFVYRDCSLTVTNPVAGGTANNQAVRQHSNSIAQGLLFENIVSDNRLIVDAHGLLGDTWTVHRNCQYTSVVYVETGGSGPRHPSKIRFEDCGLIPANFTLGAGIVAGSQIEIVEGGVVIHRWAAGAWN